MKKFTYEKGITLIALIITIIVMLILVAVTISVALQAGLIGKAQTASESTNIRRIQEELVLEKANIIADLKGEIPEDFGITINSLNIPQDLKNLYSSKLTISANGTLYYKKNVSTKDANLFRSLGIEEEPENTPPDEDTIIGTWLMNYLMDGNVSVRLCFKNDNTLEFGLVFVSEEGTVLTANGEQMTTLWDNENGYRVQVGENEYKSVTLDANNNSLEYDGNTYLRFNGDDIGNISKSYKLTFTDMENLTESDYNTLDTEEINLMIFYPSTYNSLSEAMDDDANISVLLITEKDGEYTFRYAPDGDVANGEYYIFTTYLNHWVHGTGESDALINKPEYTDPITIPGGEEYATSSIKIATPEEIHELDDEATVISEALLRKIFTIVEVNN